MELLTRSPASASVNNFLLEGEDRPMEARPFDMAFMPSRSIRGASGTIRFTVSCNNVTVQAPANPPPNAVRVFILIDLYGLPIKNQCQTGLIELPRFRVFCKAR